jgi:transposase
MIPVGIDIAKEKIDIWMQGILTSLKNNEKEIVEFFKSISPKEVQMTMEATGRYHRLAHRILSRMGFSVMVINPFQSRHFAKAMNILCKTDKVDARVLCLYAEKMPFEATAVASEKEEDMQNLSRHIDDLKRVRTSLKLRLKESKGLGRESLERVIETLNAEIGACEQALCKIVQNDSELKTKKEILESIPGVGATTATMLLCLLRELGSMTRREAAALSGLAPMNFDSGKMQGKRHIQKGRHDVRQNLYMPILGAVTKHNPVLMAFYKRLIEKGKPAKVALTACMRKLIVIANSLLRKGETWQFP